MRIASIALVAVVALAAMAAWTCPAELAWRWAGPRLAPLTLDGISGTVWRGHADAVQVLGRDVGALDWALAAAPLLHGGVVARFDLRGADIRAHGTVERTGGDVAFRDAAFTLPARLAAPVLAIPALDLLGTIELDLEHARVLGLWLADAAGTAQWRDAAVAGAAQARLGDLQATFASRADGAIAGVVRDLGGPLEVAGTFTAALGRYQAQARLAPRGDNPQLAEALQYVGQPQPDGSRELLIEGRQLF